MRTALLTVPVFLLVLLTACGPTTFLVGKDGTTTFFGRLNTDLGRRLCQQRLGWNLWRHAFGGWFRWGRVRNAFDRDRNRRFDRRGVKRVRVGLGRFLR